MLQITIPEVELWDEKNQRFSYIKKQTLSLEHSLVSISKWESKWCKPFLSKESKSTEEVLDYIRCMTLTQNVSPDVYKYLSNDNIREINQYIEAPMSACTIYDDSKSPQGREKITSELIYYWMIAMNIPFECQKWHLNRLLKLIQVCSIKNRPPKKMSKQQLMNRNAALNASRRKKLNTKG